MKRNFKIMISALSVMFIMAIAVTILTFSYANNDDVNGEITDEGQIILADYDIADEYTNIDNIIMNSKATYTDADPIYRIVEIGSSDTPSTLKDFVESKGFEELVLNSHATIDDVMEADCIEYNYFSASSVTNDSADALSVISNADFIYVSHDITSEYSASNDLCEELYNILHTYAVGSYKPLVIDSPAAKASSGNGGNTNPSTGQPYSMGSLAGDVFAPTGKYYNTFAWDQNLSVEDFLTHKGGSMYLGINGNQKSKTNWVTLIDDETNPEEPADYKMAKFLTISASGSSTMTDKLLDSTKIIDNTTTKLKYGDGSPLTGVVYDIKDTLIAKNGYNGRYSVPDYVELTKVSLADLSTNDISFDEYDMIIIESDCAGSAITADLYKKFSAAMLGNLTIVYDKAMESATATTPDEPEAPEDFKESNYLELYYMVATTDNVARYQNIMVTNREQFGIITSSNSAATAKVIADLINSSSYRGIGGPTSTSSMFTVLEIQPCYPIDLERAEYIGSVKPRVTNKSASILSSVFGNGNYYTLPSDVINGKSKEQVDPEAEYYAWELSKAKIADALDLDVNQVNLVQMSTEELASSKTEILGVYDLIYVGANTTALKDVDQYQSVVGLAGWSSSINGKVSTDKYAQLPIYTMYSHVGDYVSVTLDTMGSSGGSVRGGTPFADVPESVTGQSTGGVYNPIIDSFAVLNGNDITFNKLTELGDYINAGMPIIINKELSDAYAEVKEKGYLQNKIDPDSNMFKFLAKCEASTANNVLWNFDNNAVVDTDNNGGVLGDTLTGYVSVFASEKGSVSMSDPNYGTDTQQKVIGMKESLSKIYVGSNKRPKLTITSMPATYNQYDESSKIKNGVLNFKYRISGNGKYSVSLYIDDNGNSVFDRTAEFMTSGSLDSLSFKVPSSFFGPLYWMIEVTDTENGMTTNQIGIAYVQNSKPEKQTVRVLQLVPGDEVEPCKYTAGEGPDQGAQNSLYFCTVCQQAYERLEYNPCSNGGGTRFTMSNTYKGNYGNNCYSNVMSSDGIAGGIYYGKHEHNFGIVTYDSNQPLIDSYSNGSFTYAKRNGETIYGMDNWDLNLADEISDLYDFDLDIYVRGEFERYAKEINDAYDFSGLTETQKETMIGNFNISESDVEYEYYSKLDDDGKLKFIKQRRYAEIANKYKEIYDYYTSFTAKEANATDTVKYKEMKDFTYDPVTDVITEGSVITATTVDQKAQIDAFVDKMIDNAEAIATENSCSTEMVVYELERVKRLSMYTDFIIFMNNKIAYYDYTANMGLGSSYMSEFNAYTVVKDKELTYRELYKEYSRLAAGSDWLLECYDTIVIGPSEDFAGDDFGADSNLGVYGLADLETYVSEGGNVLLFHDTLTKFADAGTVNLTTRLRGYFGMDRYHFELDENYTSDMYYLPYKTTKDPNKYFMSNLNPKDTTDSKYKTWLTNMRDALNATPSYYLSNVAYSDAIYAASESKNPCAIPYRYADISWGEAAFWNNSASFNSKDNPEYGTDKASQNNKGIVTLFPFTLSDELNIAGTHPQSYALDLEEYDMTVWYSLAGGNNAQNPNYNGKKIVGSTLYAATPRDGMDNYFIYTYKNVNYCGAGHSNVTGIGKDNNDERKLYINIICNSVKKSVMQPDIFVYDYVDEDDESVIKETNNIVKPDGDGYKIKVDSTDSYPEFSFKVVVDDEAKLENVKIFYDLDYNSESPSDLYVANNKHILIADWDKDNIEAGKLTNVYRYDATLEDLLDDTGHQIMEKTVDENGDEVEVAATTLKLKPEYFEAYNNEYTYIVIEATDNKGGKVHKRIKIYLKDKLFNLT